jgi:hypothetical protein
MIVGDAPVDLGAAEGLGIVELGTVLDGLAAGRI